MTLPAGVDLDLDVTAAAQPEAPVRARGRRARAVVVVLVVATLLVGGYAAREVSDARAAAARADRRRQAVEVDTRRLEGSIVATRRTIGALSSVLAGRTTDRDAVARSLVVTNGKLAEMRSQLDAETSGLRVLDARIQSLRACLLGVSGALNALAVGDAGTALGRLRPVGAQCDAAR